MEPQPLSLRDIHLPDAIGWWPPAMGWWLLALFIPLLCWFVIWLFKRLTRKTALKTSKKILSEIKQDTALDDIEKLSKISELIRRVAISIAPRSETASLTGLDWLQYLDSTMKDSPFTQGAGRCLANAHYQQTALTEIDIPLLISLCEHWLKAQKENKK